MSGANLTVLSIILGYLILITVLGLVVSTRVKSTSDYLIAGGRMNFLLVAMTLAGAWEGTGASIGVSQAAFTQGIYTGFYASFFAAGLVLTLFTFFKFVRFTGSLTPAELLGKLFGVETRLLTAVLLLIQNTIVLATQLIGGAGISAAVLGVPYELGLLAMLVSAGLYTVAGGLVSTAWTNVLHVVVQNVMALATIPVVLVWLGGWDTLVGSLPHRFFGVEGMGFANLTSWWWTLGLGVIVVGFQQIHQAASSREAARGFWLAAGLTAFYSMPFALLGVAAAARFPDIPALQALPTVAINVHPVFAGLLLASVLAAALSTIGPVLSGMPLFFVNDVYRVARAQADEREQLWVARAFTLLTALIAIAIALATRQIIVANIFAFTFRSVLLFAIVAGLLFAGRRWITAEGAFAGLLAGAAGSFISQFTLPDQPPVYLAALFLITGTAIVSAVTHRRGHFSRSVWDLLVTPRPAGRPVEGRPGEPLVA